MSEEEIRLDAIRRKLLKALRRANRRVSELESAIGEHRISKLPADVNDALLYEVIE